MEKLRVQLQTINHKILQLYCERKQLVEAIVTKKGQQTPATRSYSPRQEWQVFGAHQGWLIKLELLELLSFSLLMEAQVRKFAANYPAWSQGVHLTCPASEIIQHSNPLLLKLVCPKQFCQLPITTGFKQLWDETVKDLW